MARALRFTTVVRDNPPWGQAHVLRAGEVPPEWALPFLGEHLFNDDSPLPIRPITKVEPQPEVEPESLVEEEPSPSESDKVEVPSRQASRAIWAKFAGNLGVEVKKGQSRDDIVEAVALAHPDLEIPEE